MSEDSRCRFGDNSKLISNGDKVNLAKCQSVIRVSCRTWAHLAGRRMLDARDQELELTLSVEGRHFGGRSEG